MRNPDITAKEACPKCNNTGTRIIKGRNYEYSVPCVETKQQELKEVNSELVKVKAENQAA